MSSVGIGIGALFMMFWTCCQVAAGFSIASVCVENDAWRPWQFMFESTGFESVMVIMSCEDFHGCCC